MSSSKRKSITVIGQPHVTAHFFVGARGWLSIFRVTGMDLRLLEDIGNCTTVMVTK